MLSTPDSSKGSRSLSVKLLSFSLVKRGPYPTDKPPTRLFCSYFYSRFHPHTSYNSTGCAIYSTRGRFCFHHGQNRKLHALPPPSASPIKMTSSCALDNGHGESVGRPGPRFAAGDDLFACSDGCSCTPASLHSVSYRRDFVYIRGVDIVINRSISLFPELLTRAKPF